ncbi:hypothetical protein ACGFJT_37075 [Actinomadura geliboluensis]|uniref:hypothetical protein n=1 Tax=Actinomadura geliboluensis TaxID=882440 RepID=UPI003719C33E
MKPFHRAHTSDNGTAISLEEVQQTAPGLVSHYEQTSVSLTKHSLAGERATAYLILDRSRRMRPYGSVQHLAKQALAVFGQLADGSAPVVFFDSRAHSPSNCP